VATKASDLYSRFGAHTFASADHEPSKPFEAPHSEAFLFWPPLFDIASTQKYCHAAGMISMGRQPRWPMAYVHSALPVVGLGVALIATAAWIGLLSYGVFQLVELVL
jgi:hypothetical protein